MMRDFNPFAQIVVPTTNQTVNIRTKISLNESTAAHQLLYCTVCLTLVLLVLKCYCNFIFASNPADFFLERRPTTSHVVSGAGALHAATW